MPSVWEQLRHQNYLGDDTFVEEMQRKLAPERSLKDIPRQPKLAPVKPLS